jgi:anhydro-N-acetylmuramic acid kinase
MISGTSHDGVDASVVDFTLHGDALTMTVIHSDSIPYPAELRERLLAVLPPSSTTLAEVCELDTRIGQCFAQVATQVATSVGGVDAVVSHGQTVYHWVQDGDALGTLQIGQAAWIAEALGVPVVSDLRIRDITAGGHGAPLVSFLDALLLQHRDDRAAALNLGGIANVTVCEDEQAVAYDIGPANALVDAVIVDRKVNTLGFDRDGVTARAGRVDDALLALFLEHPYFSLPSPKSTGKELFHLGYVDETLDRFGRDISVADLIRTLTEVTIRSVAHEVRAKNIGYLVMSGGGCHNPVIVDGIRAACPGTSVVFSDELGLPTDHKEAIAFALLGWCTMNGIASTLPSATGARSARVLGTITPGREPLQLPVPSTITLEAMTLHVTRK